MPHVLRGAKAQPPKAERPVCQGYCGVCGRVSFDGSTPCILITVRHRDGAWLSACRKCWRWWHIADDTRVPRIIEVTNDGVSMDTGSVPEEGGGGSDGSDEVYRVLTRESGSTVAKVRAGRGNKVRGKGTYRPRGSPNPNAKRE